MASISACTLDLSLTTKRTFPPSVSIPAGSTAFQVTGQARRNEGKESKTLTPFSANAPKYLNQYNNNKIISALTYHVFHLSIGFCIHSCPNGFLS